MPFAELTDLLTRRSIFVDPDTVVHVSTSAHGSLLTLGEQTGRAPSVVHVAEDAELALNILEMAMRVGGLL